MGRGRASDDVEVDAAGRLDATEHGEVVIGVAVCSLACVKQSNKRMNDR
jgi:hypothetical protein